MTLVSLAATMVLVSVAQTAGAQTDPQTKVAIVNVAMASESYAKTTDLEAQFEQLRTKYRDEINAKRDRLERGIKALREEFKPGTAEFDQRQQELAQLEWELKYYQEMEGAKLERSLAASLRQIFADIQRTVGQVAQERGCDVVLAADELPSDTPDTTNMARQQILLQKVLYWSPRVDLTQEVVARLNAQYQATRPATPGTSALPVTSKTQVAQAVPNDKNADAPVRPVLAEVAKQ